MKLIPVIKIIRPVNLLITFFSVLISAVISSTFSAIDVNVLISAITVSLAFAAGYVINDIIDFEIDKINRPERVLPQGLISIRSAKWIYVILIFVSLFFATLVSTDILIIIASLNILLFFYSIYFKKLILLSNFVVAAATCFPLVLGGMVVGNIEGGLIPAGFAFLTNFIREIIKDMEDIKGDSSKLLKTFPQKVGIKQAIYFSSAVIILLMIFDTLPFLFNVYNVEYFFLIMVVVNPIFVYILKIINNYQSLKTLRKSSNLVKLNMLIGLIAILIGAQ